MFPPSPSTRLYLLLFSALVLAGCTTQKGSEQPGSSAPPIFPSVEQQPPAPPGAPRAPQSDASQATLALLDRSREASDAGDRSRATAYLERAIRLEPRRADLWVELGRLQLPEAPVAAERYARKALSLAASEPLTQRDAWLLIAEAKAEAGDTAGAAEIRQRYRSFKG